MESFRNFVQSWVGRAFLIAVLVVFVVFAFAPQFSPPGAQGEVAEVNGDKIMKAELDNAVESVMARYGEQIDRKTLEQLVSRDAVLESLIRQRVMIAVARGDGLVVSPALVQEMITGMEAFHDASGKFSQETFQQVILRNGFPNAGAFRKRVEEELLSAQLTGALRDSAFATRQDLELVTRIGEQQRDVAWLSLSPEAFVTGVSVTEADVQARYDANPAGYLTEEQFAIEYVQVDLADYAADESIGEPEVKAKYDEMVARASENAERRVAHILINIDATRDEAQAKARADEALAKLAAGETFAKVAAAYSDDTGTREQGGDLGFVGRTALDPALDTALFALKQGDVSAAVRGESGLHILKFLESRGVDMPSLAEARGDIADGLRREKARAKFDEVVDELGTLAYESDNLADPAAKVGLPLRSTPLFGRQGGAGIAANPKVLEEVLSPDVLEDGRNSGVVQTADGQAVVLRLKEHRKAARRPLAEVAGEIRAELVREKAIAQAGEQAKALREQLAGGQAIEQVAAAAGLAVQRVAGAQRMAGGLPPELLEAAFRVKRPAAGAVGVDSVALKNGGHVVMAVSNVVDGAMLGVSPEEQLARRQELGSAFGRFDYSRFIEQSTADADVVRVAAKGEGDEGGILDKLKELRAKAQENRP